MSKKNQKDQAANQKKYPWTVKRVAAWVAIIVLVAMYVVTFILACLSSPKAQTAFRAALFCTIFIPVACWIFIFLWGFFTNRKTIASFNLMNSNKEARQEMEEAVRKDAEKEEEHPAE